MTQSDLALVKKHRDDVDADDRPSWADGVASRLACALDNLLDQVKALPGLCVDCQHFDDRASGVVEFGFCTHASSHHAHRAMPPTEGCSKWAERDDSWAVYPS